LIFQTFGTLWEWNLSIHRLSFRRRSQEPSAACGKEMDLESCARRQRRVPISSFGEVAKLRLTAPESTEWLHVDSAEDFPPVGSHCMLCGKTRRRPWRITPPAMTTTNIASGPKRLLQPPRAQGGNAPCARPPELAGDRARGRSMLEQHLKRHDLVSRRRQGMAAILIPSARKRPGEAQPAPRSPGLRTIRKTSCSLSAGLAGSVEV
jgi:hypothetical protein